MRRAWSIARFASQKFKIGSASHYLSGSMKLAWAEAKAITKLLSLSNLFDKRKIVRKFNGITEFLKSTKSRFMNIIYQFKAHNLKSIKSNNDALRYVFMVTPVTNLPVYSAI
ncbi:hypothetical protein [Photobacterium leiognathi]|uniref:hypothetical protein n=1 Tax=Photobacterium leiognathi TaxID=553611 RepID=UPI00387F4F30